MKLILEKDVDPLSGMTVNLSVVDRWWSDVRIDNSSPEAALTSFQQYLVHLVDQEGAQIREIRLEKIGPPEGVHALLWTPDFQAEVDSLEFNKASGTQFEKRRAFVTFRQSENLIKKDNLRNFLEGPWPLDLKAARIQFPGLLKIEVLDLFQNFIEFDWEIPN